MIDPKELRIGNLVGFYKSELSDLQTGCVDEIARDEEGYVVLVPEFSRRYFSVNGLKPIPLTEEWLLKFGFEREALRNHYDFKLELNRGIEGDDVYHVLHIGFQEMGHSLNIERYYNDTRSNIMGLHWKRRQICEYVHQLQNLYFALTGKDL